MSDTPRVAARRDSLTLTHYRTDHETYVDSDLWQADQVELGWEAQYTWFRMLSGPEYTRRGFPLALVAEAFSKPREFAYESAIDSLLHAGLIIERDDHYLYPNVIWGTPPAEGEQ